MVELTNWRMTVYVYNALSEIVDQIPWHIRICGHLIRNILHLLCAHNCVRSTNWPIYRELLYIFCILFAKKGCWARFDRPIRSLWLTIVINLMRIWVERIKKSQNVGLLSKKIIIVECTPGGRFRSIFRLAIFRFQMSGPIFKYWMKTFDKMLLFQIIMQKYALGCTILVFLPQDNRTIHFLTHKKRWKGKKISQALNILTLMEIGYVSHSIKMF